jgi:ribonuclease Z
MELHCLGTAGYHPSDNRHTSCYCLPSDGIVLDAGSGIFRLIPLIRTDRLDILLSHAHLDHIVGLTFLLDILYRRPVAEVFVWGEAAKLAAVREHLFQELIFPAPIDVKWRAIDELPSFQIGATQAVTVDWRRQTHPGGSVAYRLNWPHEKKSLVYVTDSSGDASAESIRWMHAADLLMHECYFRDNEKQWAVKTGHCWTSRAAEIAIEAQAKKLLLTHINPLADGDDPVGIKIASAIYPAAMVASDGDVISF